MSNVKQRRAEVKQLTEELEPLKAALEIFLNTSSWVKGGTLLTKPSVSLLVHAYGLQAVLEHVTRQLKQKRAP